MPTTNKNGLKISLTPFFDDVSIEKLIDRH